MDLESVWVDSLRKFFFNLPPKRSHEVLKNLPFEDFTNLFKEDREARMAMLYLLVYTLPNAIRKAFSLEGREVSSNETARIGEMLERFFSYGMQRKAYEIDQPHALALAVLQYQLFSEIPVLSPSLDLGIGDGWLSSLIFAEQKPTIGSDPHPLLVKIARQSFPAHEHYFVIDAQHLPFEDNTFNSVTMVHAIDHVKSRLEVLQECARVLRQGGTLLFSDVSEFAKEMLPLGKIAEATGFPQLKSAYLEWVTEFVGEAGNLGVPLTWYRKTIASLDMKLCRSQYFMSSKLAAVCYIFFEVQKAFNISQQTVFYQKGGERAVKTYLSFLKKVVAPLICEDEAIIEREGKGENIFLFAQKRGELAGGAPSESDIFRRIVCPVCRTKVSRNDDGYLCSNCHIPYPVKENIAFLSPCLGRAYREILGGD